MVEGYHEVHGLRNRRFVFKDRFQAGKVVAGMLEPEYGRHRDAMVLAIPAGGVPVGLEISRDLGLPFDLVIVRKLQIPGNTEAGFGAMTMEGSAFFNQDLVQGLNLSLTQIEEEADRVSAELEKRNRVFRGGKPFPDLPGKTVLLVDDGLASGYTMMAAIDTARKAEAQKVVVAVPTAPLRTIRRLESLADEIYCANVREAASFAVAEAYEAWYDLNDEDILRLLRVDGAGAGVDT